MVKKNGNEGNQLFTNKRMKMQNFGKFLLTKMIDFRLKDEKKAKKRNEAPTYFASEIQKHQFCITCYCIFKTRTIREITERKYNGANHLTCSKFGLNQIFTQKIFQDIEKIVWKEYSFKYAELLKNINKTEYKKHTTSIFNNFEGYFLQMIKSKRYEQDTKHLFLTGKIAYVRINGRKRLEFSRIEYESNTEIINIYGTDQAKFLKDRNNMIEEYQFNKLNRFNKRHQIVPEENEYVIEKIIDIQAKRTEEGLENNIGLSKIMVMVKWEGFSIDESTYEPASSLKLESICLKLLGDLFLNFEEKLKVLEHQNRHRKKPQIEKLKKKMGLTTFVYSAMISKMIHKKIEIQEKHIEAFKNIDIDFETLSITLEKLKKKIIEIDDGQMNEKNMKEIAEMEDEEDFDVTIMNDNTQEIGSETYEDIQRMLNMNIFRETSTMDSRRERNH